VHKNFSNVAIDYVKTKYNLWVLAPCL